jgi:chitin-binding protein
VAGYRLYRNGVAVGTTTNLNYTVSGLTCGTSYTIGLTAFDAAGNESNRSYASGTTSTSACPVSTPTPTPDTQAPSVPQGMAWTTKTKTSLGLRWNASTDNRGVVGYRLYRNGTLVTTTTNLAYDYTGLNCGTSYTMALTAIDAAGNESNRIYATGTTSTLAC